MSPIYDTICGGRARQHLHNACLLPPSFLSLQRCEGLPRSQDRAASDRSVACPDFLLMAISSLKQCSDWETNAVMFAQQSSSFAMRGGDVDRTFLFEENLH